MVNETRRAAGEHESDGTQPRQRVSAAQRRRALLPLAIDVALPLVAYYLLRHFGLGATGAYTGAVIVSVLRLGLSALRDRKINGIAAFMLAMCGVELLVSLATHDLRMVVAGHSVLSGVTGLTMLVTCAVGRPAFQMIALRVAGTSESRRAAIEHNWATLPGYRRMMQTLTLGIGIGLLTEALVRIALITVMSPDALVTASRVLQLAAVVALVAWVAWYVKRAIPTWKPGHETH